MSFPTDFYEGQRVYCFDLDGERFDGTFNIDHTSTPVRYWIQYDDGVEGTVYVFDDVHPIND